MSELSNNLLNNVYRIDQLFTTFKEIYNKYKNRSNTENKIFNNPKDIFILRLSTDFTKYPNILINQLIEVEFNCKDCFKVFLLIYRNILYRNEMCLKCKKEYIRKLTKLNRMTLDRSLKELEEKNMLLIEKIGNYFHFTLNLCFLSWNLEDSKKEIIRENIELENNKYRKKYIDEEVFFD